MIYLLLSIIFLTGIFLTFKIINIKELPVLNIVVINYFLAAILGSIQSQTSPTSLLSENWINFAFVIGILFFVFFIVIGKSVELVGLSATTVASKMSVVIPIIFSIIYYKEDINALKIIGILLAIIGVIFTVYKKEDGGIIRKKNIFIIPLILFIGLGVTDLLFGYSQKEFSIKSPELFNSIVFLISFLSSLIYVFIKKQSSLFKDIQVLKYGIILGFTNYLGVYFFMKALGSGIFESSIIFGVNNVSIVILSALIGVLIFKESASKVNILGILSSVTAIILLSFS